MLALSTGNSNNTLAMQQDEEPMKPWIRQTILTVVAASFSLFGTAQADSINPLPFFNGEILFTGFDGTAVPTGGSVSISGEALIGDATGVHFDDLGSLPFAINGVSNILVFGTSDDFGAIAPLTSVQMFDFALASPIAPIPLWQIVTTDITYQFIAESITVVMQNNTFLNLTARGVVSATGYQDTNAAWAFSLNRIGENITGWHATTSVPEPGMLALFGIGLLGAGIARRGRKVAVSA